MDQGSRQAYPLPVPAVVGLDDLGRQACCSVAAVEIVEAAVEVVVVGVAGGCGLERDVPAVAARVARGQLLSKPKAVVAQRLAASLKLTGRRLA